MSPPSTGSTKARRYPLSYIYSGNYYGTGEVGNQGTGGSWWTHTAYDSSTAYRLGMSSTGLNSQLDYAKNGGFSLRNANTTNSKKYSSTENLSIAQMLNV